LIIIDWFHFFTSYGNKNDGKQKSFRAFFAGEVLDLDGITGGFNFQSAWATGFIAGISCGKDCHLAVLD
jgi:hypothetical protein